MSHKTESLPPCFILYKSRVATQLSAELLNETANIYANRLQKDFKTLEYIENHIAIRRDDKFQIPLSEIFLKQSEDKEAETYNRVNSFLKYMEHRDLELVFLTTTLKSSFHKPNSLEEIKEGYEVLKEFNKSVRDDNLFKEPTPARMKKYRAVTEWSYILPSDFHFMKMTEFHKDMTVHQHQSIFLPAQNMLDFIKLISRKKKMIGRTDVVLSRDFKNEILSNIQFDGKFKDKDTGIWNYYIGNKSSGDIFIVRFLRAEKNKQDTKKAVVKYVTKYVIKNLIGSKENKESVESVVARGIVTELNLRLFTTSRTLFPLQIYRKVTLKKSSSREYLSNKYSLFDLTILRDENKLKIDMKISEEYRTVFIKDIDYEVERKVKFIESIKFEVDENIYTYNSKEWGIIHNDILRLSNSSESIELDEQMEKEIKENGFIETEYDGIDEQNFNELMNFFSDDNLNSGGGDD